MARLRSLSEASAATVGAALERAVAAADSAHLAQQRSLLAAAELSATREQVLELRSDLAALREELVWAFAARKADVEGPITVIDLRQETSSTA